jgi:hypothetical protein
LESSGALNEIPACFEHSSCILVLFDVCRFGRGPLRGSAGSAVLRCGDEHVCVAFSSHSAAATSSTTSPRSLVRFVIVCWILLATFVFWICLQARFIRWFVEGVLCSASPLRLTGTQAIARVRPSSSSSSIANTNSCRAPMSCECERGDPIHWLVIVVAHGWLAHGGSVDLCAAPGGWCVPSCRWNVFVKGMQAE